MLKLGGCRQHHIAMQCRIGEEVLQYHGKKIVSAQPAKHTVLVWANRSRVGVVDHQRANCWTRELALQRLGKAAHVDGPRASRD